VKRLQGQILWTLKARQAIFDGTLPSEPRFVFIASWKKGRLMDNGNYVQACKALLDSLQPHFIVSDTPKWCHDHYAQRLASKDKMPIGTVVMIWRIKALREGTCVSFAG
jgi:uncharacterized membrane protein (GlpM family)